MLEKYGNMLSTDCDVLVVTTNGFVTKYGKAVMGRGIAKQIATLFPDIPYKLGDKIRTNGNIVQPILKKEQTIVVSFPVKPDFVIYDGTNIVNHAKSKFKINDIVAGFYVKADINLIEKSLIKLVQYADNNPQFKVIILPRVGCGAGELDWNDVKPLMEKYLDNKFIAMTYSK